MQPPDKLKRFRYTLRYTQKGEPSFGFEIRLQSRRAYIGLDASDTLELWITAAEMPYAISDMVDERTWNAHRPAILAILAEHYLPARD